MFTKLLGSLDNSKDGYSGRKLSAFQSVVMASLLSFGAFYICSVNKYIEPLIWLIGLWLLAAFVFLSIITIPQLLMALKTLKGDSTTTEIKTEFKQETTETTEKTTDNVE